jgi:xanthine dehydrogenase YagR molybdenum-binding subunit
MNGFTVNGQSQHLPEALDTTLIDVLREHIGLTGTKLVCGSGVCGACTVLLEGEPVVSCLLPARAARGKSVVTIEGIEANGLHPVQRAFVACDALQCGFCTSGFVVEAVAVHDAWRRTRGTLAPSRQELAAALAGHLCRCGAYPAIYRAVSAACAAQHDTTPAHGPRVEAHDKVTGRAKYTVDIKHPGQLEGVILRSAYAHARVVELDLSAARQCAGVKAVVSLLGRDRMVRFPGQEIAALAAVDRRTAVEALAAIVVRYEPMAAAIGMDAARREDAPLVFPGLRKTPTNSAEGPLLPAFWSRNLRGPTQALSDKPRKARQLIAAARVAGDPLLVEGTWRTDAQCHTTFEPHAAVARWDGETLTVHASTQAVSTLAAAIADRFSVPRANVRVIADHVGGGFGSKIGLRPETVAAVALARAAQAPVRVVLDRHEELAATGYRPGSELSVALLPGRDGSLKALSIKAFADAGIGVNSTIAALARLIYPAEAKELVDYDVVSNVAPGAPFRGPGGPVLCFALEQAVDEAAVRLGIDPIRLRQQWDPDVNRQRLYAWAQALPQWKAREPHTNGRFRRGVGAAAGTWFYFWQPGCGVELSVRNGRLMASTATQDMGNGSRTVLATTVAQAFALSPDEIDVRIGDSRLPPGPLSGGSRSTATLVPAALLAADRLKAELRRQSNRPIGDADDWRAILAAAPDTQVTAGRPADSPQTQMRSVLDEAGMMGVIFRWILRRFVHVEVGAGAPSSVAMATVEVDTRLGQIRVLQITNGLAVGRIATPDLARSQVEGAVIQGIGYALYETRQLDPLSGQVLTIGLEDYRIPGIADTPEIDIHFADSGFEHVPGGSVGLGEIATLPVAAAIANAVCNATGVRPHALPLRPDRVLAMLTSGAAS